MKTKLAIALKSALMIAFVMCCFSCEKIKNDQAKSNFMKNAEVVNGYEIKIIEYDSCEYLISGYGHSQMMTHKGNCKHCTKRYFK